MSELYDDRLLALARSEAPLPDHPTHTGTAKNRFCADAVTLGFVVRDGRVREAGWEGEACAICRASAQELCAALCDEDVGELDAQRAALDAVLAGSDEGPWAPFGRVRAYASRAACARLPFEAAQLALRGGQASRAPSTGPHVYVDDPWAAALAFRERGLAVALATLVEVVGSSPCPLGSTMVIASNGEFWGAVSGGCVESAVVMAALELLGGRRGPGVDAYQIANSQAGEVGLPCGGRVRIHLGPAPGDDQLRGYQARGRGLARVIELGSGRESLQPDEGGTRLEGERFFAALLAPPRLVLVGGTRVAQVLARLAAPLDFEVVVIEPRPGFAGPGRFACEVLEERPERVLAPLLDGRSAVVMLTHDAAVDDPGLTVALASEALYVGALGSRKTQAARLRRLSRAGVPAERLARLRGPAGLPIGAVGPEEIALSILAEVVAARRAAEPSAIGCVVLAAGSSERAGSANKLLHPVDGHPLVRWAVEAATRAALGPVVVVLGHQAGAVREVLADLPVQFVVNAQHEAGMGRSIAAGLEAIAAHPVGAAFVVLGDMPGVRDHHLRRLASAHTRATQHLVVVPVAGEGEQRRRGNPVLWPRRYFDALMALRGDVGGRGILARAPGAVLEVAVPGDAVLRDVDRLET